MDELNLPQKAYAIVYKGTNEIANWKESLAVFGWPLDPQQVLDQFSDKDDLEIIEIDMTPRRPTPPTVPLSFSVVDEFEKEIEKMPLSEEYYQLNKIAKEIALIVAPLTGLEPNQLPYLIGFMLARKGFSAPQPTAHIQGGKVSWVGNEIKWPEKKETSGKDEYSMRNAHWNSAIDACKRAIAEAGK